MLAYRYLLAAKVHAQIKGHTSLNVTTCMTHAGEQNVEFVLLSSASPKSSFGNTQ